MLSNETTTIYKPESVYVIQIPRRGFGRTESCPPHAGGGVFGEQPTISYFKRTLRLELIRKQRCLFFKLSC